MYPLKSKHRGMEKAKESRGEAKRKIEELFENDTYKEV